MPILGWLLKPFYRRECLYWVGWLTPSLPQPVQFPGRKVHLTLDNATPTDDVTCSVVRGGHWSSAVFRATVETLRCGVHKLHVHLRLLLRLNTYYSGGGRSFLECPKKHLEREN